MAADRRGGSLCSHAHKRKPRDQRDIPTSKKTAGKLRDFLLGVGHGAISPAKSSYKHIPSSSQGWGRIGHSSVPDDKEN